LGRRDDGHTQTVLDLRDGIATAVDAQARTAHARHADWPVNEADLVARQNWLVRERESLTARLMADPEWCDPKAAGWWVWGISCWIGGGFGEREVGKCQPRTDGLLYGASINTGKLPEVDGAKHGRRVHAGKMPRYAGHVSGNGINAGGKLLHLSSAGTGMDACSGIAILAEVAARFRDVRVACGDWRRVVSPSTLAHKYVPSVGVVLDPPYSQGDQVVYSERSEDIAHVVRAWCLEHGDIPTLRIALCGYAGEHDELEAHGWSVHAWKAAGGYGNQSDGAGRENSHRERVWFSPHCLSAAQGSLF
jgi:hypothetical protein